MREAVIVSTARTPIGKAYRGAFNNTEAPTLGGHAIRHAVERAGLESGEVDDVIMGCALPQGSQGANVARLAALAAGLPVTTAGMTVDRQCSSGMMAIALAAKTVISDGVDIQLVEIGFTHPDLHFEIVYGVSDNPAPFFDNSNAERLGYRPRDRALDHLATEELRTAEPDLQSADGTHVGGHFVES